MSAELNKKRSICFSNPEMIYNTWANTEMNILFIVLSNTNWLVYNRPIYR